MAKKIIRVEIEVDACVNCPDGAEELSDLLYGIGDGQMDGRVMITDSPVVPDEPSYVVPAAPGLDGVVVVWNIDGLGPVLPLEGLLVAFRDFQVDKVDNGRDTMKEAIKLIEEISRIVVKKPVVRLADEFYSKTV